MQVRSIDGRIIDYSTVNDSKVSVSTVKWQSMEVQSVAFNGSRGHGNTVDATECRVIAAS